MGRRRKKEVKKTWLDPPLAPEVVYREQGLNSVRRGQYAPALAQLNKALELDPKNLRLITGRAAANLGLFQHGAAISDADNALSLAEEDVPTCTNLKARALMESGEFEKALVTFHRGKRRRTCPDYFVTGVQQAEETVEDTIGRNVGEVLWDFRDAIRERDEVKRDHVLSAVSRRVAAQPPTVTLTPEQVAFRTRVERKVECCYLGRLAEHKRFIVDKMTELNQGPLRPSAKCLTDIAQTSLNILCNTQETLRKRRPLYALRYCGAHFSPGLKEKVDAEVSRRSAAANYQAQMLISQLRTARSQGDILLVIRCAERFREYLDGKSAMLIPLSRYEELLKIVCEEVAEAHVDSLRADPSAPPGADRLRACIKMGAPLPTTQRSTVTKFVPFVDQRRIINRCQRRLLESKSALENAWLNHDLARAYVQLVQPAHTKLYARRCMKSAQQADNATWGIVARILVAKAEMIQNNRQEAIDCIKDAAAIARRTGYTEVAEFLEICEEVCDVAQGEEGEADATAECDRIELLMASPTLRGDMRQLFQRMRVAPMSFIPGLAKVK